MTITPGTRFIGAAVAVACCAGLVAAPREPLAAQEPVWTVLTEPETRFGEVFGRDAYQFTSIVSAHFLPGGDIAVADGGALEIRVFDRDGVFLRSFGRSGSGPGEFGRISAMWLTSRGRIGVWDSRTRRISVFTTQGELVSSQLMRAPAAAGNLDFFVGSFRNDDVVLGALSFAPTPPGPPRAIADRVVLSRFGLNGELRESLGEADGLWRYEHRPIPFSSVPAAVLLRDSLLVADGYDARVEVRVDGGTTIRRIALPPAGTASTDVIWTSLERNLQDDGKTLFVQYLRDGSVPRDTRFPQIGGLLTDDAGNLWVKAYDPTKDSIWLRVNSAMTPAPGGEWRVVRPDGRLVATVSLPDAVRPLEIRGNRLLGVATDDLGVERVVVHDIVRHRSGPIDTPARSRGRVDS